ncbi:MAG: hypothetical protein ACYCT9_01675 [Leptospirillum sp.]
MSGLSFVGVDTIFQTIDNEKSSGKKCSSFGKGSKNIFGAIPNRTLLDLNGHRSHLLWMEEILGVCFLHQSVGDELVWAIPPGAGFPVRGFQGVSDGLS